MALIIGSEFVGSLVMARHADAHPRYLYLDEPLGCEPGLAKLPWADELVESRLAE
jgi:hypothetical protein